MINTALKVGDYIFTAKGCLARITKINKQTYTYAVIAGYDGMTNIPFNGIRYSRFNNAEWFVCDDIQAKALELASQRYKSNLEVANNLKEAKELIGKAKYFLNQIEDIEEVVLQEVENKQYDN